MKKLNLIPLLLLAFSCSCFSKEIKTALFYVKILPKNLETHQENYSWTINGQIITTNKDLIKIKINYPLFDTITLTKANEKRIILTRFYMNHIYELSPFSGLSDIEIYDVEKLKLYKAFLSKIKEGTLLEDKLYRSFDSLKSVTETGRVIFKLKNYTEKELIGGTFGLIDWNFTSGKVLANNKSIEIKEPFTSGNSNFCFDITVGIGMIVKENAIYNDSRNINFDYDEGRLFVYKETLFSTEYRFFNNEILIVTYDGKTKQVNLKLK